MMQGKITTTYRTAQYYPLPGLILPGLPAERGRIIQGEGWYLQYIHPDLIGENHGPVSTVRPQIRSNGKIYEGIIVGSHSASPPHVGSPVWGRVIMQAWIDTIMHGRMHGIKDAGIRMQDTLEECRE
jgi:hypothetical protein